MLTPAPLCSGATAESALLQPGDSFSLLATRPDLLFRIHCSPDPDAATAGQAPSPTPPPASASASGFPASPPPMDPAQAPAVPTSSGSGSRIQPVVLILVGPPGSGVAERASQSHACRVCGLLVPAVLARMQAAERQWRIPPCSTAPPHHAAPPCTTTLHHLATPSTTTPRHHPAPPPPPPTPH